MFPRLPNLVNESEGTFDGRDISSDNLALMLRELDELDNEKEKEKTVEEYPSPDEDIENLYSGLVQRRRRRLYAMI